MNRGPGGEEKVGYHKTSNFPSIGVFTVSPRPQELTNCLRGQAAPLPAPPATTTALARLRPPLPARQWDPVYCLSICRQRGRPNRDVHFITSACSGTSGRFQRCSEMHRADAQEMHRADAQGPASPFAIVSFKDGEKKNVKLQTPKTFLPSYCQARGTRSRGRRARAASHPRQKKGTGRNSVSWSPLIPQPHG